jgi:hypothetical protein
MFTRLAPFALALSLSTLACTAPSASSEAGSAVSSADTAPYSWPIPAGWSDETDAFPLFWAPDLGLAGTLVLRFAPGFSEPTSDTYFSYSYAWVLDGDPGFSADTLAADLTTYYAGLARTFDATHFDPAATHADIEFTEPGAVFHGVVSTVDPFNGSPPVSLHVEATQSVCGGHHVLLFTLSPHAEDTATWATLGRQRSTFECTAQN